MDSAAAQDSAPASTQLASETWQRISPLSAIYFAVKFISAVLQNGVQALAPVAAVVATGGDKRWVILGMIGAGAALVLLAGAVLSYLYFKYRVDKDAFLIRSGVLKRKRLTLSFDRIQSVNLSEPFYFRPFGLVVVTLESAGSSDEEVSLGGIASDRAREIRQLVLDYKKGHPADAANRDTVEAAADHDPGELLLHQPIGELVRYGISNNNIWVMAGLVAALFSQFDNWWESAVVRGAYEDVGAYVGTGALAVGAFILFVAFVVLLLLLLASIIGAVVMNYNYKLSYGDGRYHRARGLFSRQETSVPKTKVQSLRIAQPLIARFIDRFHLTLNQVGFEQQQMPNKRQKFIIPSVRADFNAGFTARLFDGTKILAQPLKPISSLFIARTVGFYIVPIALIVAVIWAFFFGLVALVPLVVPLLALPLVTLRQRRYGYASDGTHGLVQKGLFGHSKTIFPFYKAQTVELIQTDGQRRRGVATLKVKLAGRSLTIPYMPIDDARSWRAAILRAVETSERNWM